MAESNSNSSVYWLVLPLLMAGLLTSPIRSAPGSDEDAPSRKPEKNACTAAFLDLDGSPLATLLEQRLLDSDRAQWLERNEIEAIQREQKLDGLAGAAAGRQRAALGKLLKADLLVFLKHAKEPKEHVQLVVCETARGLRLAVHRMPYSPKVEDDVEQLAAVVEWAIAKHGQNAREICAVPPFVSNDLTFEDEHLKSAYAKLVEQTVRDLPGLLTVELEEARAVARETAIAGEGVRRPMPLYLLGDFRHKGTGDDRTATIRMRAMRGERELADREASGLSSAGAAKFVQRAAGELVQQTLGIQPMPPNAKLEAAQLARQAETFHLLGSWEEAAAMAEAALMLDPQRKRMHDVAASSLAGAARQVAVWRNGPDSVARGIHIYLRALEHFEIRLPDVTGRLVKHDLWRLHNRLGGAVPWHSLALQGKERPEVRSIAAELRERELETLLRMTRARCIAQTGDEYRFLDWAVFSRPRQEQFDITLQVVRSIQHLPGADGMIYRLTLHGYSPTMLDNPEGRRYLQRLKTADSEAMRRAGARLEKALNESVAAERRDESAESAAAGPGGIGPSDLRFEPVELVCAKVSDRQLGLPAFGDLIPAGEGVDLVRATINRLYVMKEPGKLKVIWDCGFIGGCGTHIRDLDFDGRFAWATTHHPKRAPRLLVIEPRQEQIWEIDTDDGLPVVAPETIRDRNAVPQLWVEPIRPGKVLLVSWFGRMAIGTVTFDPDKGSKVDVFFEARHSRDATTNEPWRDPQMAFPPSYVIGFRGADGRGRPLWRALVGAPQYLAGYGRHDRPLVIDPQSKRVHVLPRPIGSAIEPHELAFTADAAYRIQITSTGKQLCLERIGLPDLEPETIMTNVPEGYCLKHGDKFVVLGSRCWLVDPKAEPGEGVRVIAARPPWAYYNGTAPGAAFVGDAAEPPEELEPFRLLKICRSNHFGILAVRKSRKRNAEFFRLVFPGQ